MWLLIISSCILLIKKQHHFILFVFFLYICVYTQRTKKTCFVHKYLKRPDVCSSRLNYRNKVSGDTTSISKKLVCLFLSLLRRYFALLLERKNPKGWNLPQHVSTFYGVSDRWPQFSKCTLICENCIQWNDSLDILEKKPWFSHERSSAHSFSWWNSAKDGQHLCELVPASASISVSDSFQHFKPAAKI